jgi:hypothetical protein
MRFSPAALLILLTVGCDSAPEPKTPPSDAKADEAPLSQPVQTEPEPEEVKPHPFQVGMETSIVLPNVMAAGTGAASKFHQKYSRSNEPTVNAVQYLQEAVQRMTGRELPITFDDDLSKGIVLTILENAAEDIKSDPKIIQALSSEDKDAYNAVEAFYIRTESERILLVANTPDGLRHAVVELLESVGYEVLGMGPNWIHVPDVTTKPLTFDLEYTGRPGLYNRTLWATSAQERGNGTLLEVFDPSDETVGDSYLRWQIGRRIVGMSMPQVGGHSMQAYHRTVAEEMRARNITDGFLTSQTLLGKNADRPAVPEAEITLWINTDDSGSPEEGKVFQSRGGEWVEQNPREYRASIDVTLPWVREIVLEDLKARAGAHFEKGTDGPLVFGVDPEDGSGYANFAKFRKNPNWHPDYLKQEKVPFGAPYMLDGVKGLDQPFEVWDPDSQTDTVFGFSNWLGREYDKWIDSLPESERVTSTGKDRKELLTFGLLCYNYYDVPPNFNLDQRIRVKISGFPKHRGSGKWGQFASGDDMARAFQVLLPKEPSDTGWYISNAWYNDHTLASIGNGSPLPDVIAQRVADAYRAGFRGIGGEMDFNFGRLGLANYLYTKMFWNPLLTSEELTEIRDQWLHRAYGEGWKEMQSYYEMMSPDGFINAPNTWAKATHLIADADAKIDPAKEPAAQRRLDDLKQYWYFYYLNDTGQTKPASPALEEFVWKGQMSYMTAMTMVVRRLFDTKTVETAIGKEFQKGRAHYTPEETEAWWQKVLAHWQVTPVRIFQKAELADGTKASSIDLNDLVPVAEFESDVPNQPFLYLHRRCMNFWTFASTPGQEIGFKLSWPWVPENRGYQDLACFYGISRWNPKIKEWEQIVDRTMTSIRSQPVPGPKGEKYQLVEMRYPVALAGTYRIFIDDGSYSSHLTSLDYDLESRSYSGESHGFTFSDNLDGHTQSPVFVYVPKETKSLDLEVWDENGKKQVAFYTGLPSTELIKTRTVEIGKRGTHVIELEAGEDGSLISISGSGFYFPYLYSIPQLWAKTPSALLVPRSIAEADGLTVSEAFRTEKAEK